ncbi:hypothetical protein LTR04_001503 [Oleoguttula sp. CCFEE 6159]|nr:hypothetical protein LTR04_001503 [Oleoguttula sp. CCFEE 6159]
MSILFYRRPDYVSRSAGPLNPKDCQKYVQRTKNSKNNIPPELSFERVIENKALPPCSLRDFMDYTVYVAHEAENLQFYLWLQEYTKRFNTLKREEQALSPEWKQPEVAMPAAEVHDQPNARKASTFVVTDIDFDEGPKHNPSIAMSPVRSGSSVSPFDDPPKSAVANEDDYQSFITRSVFSQRTAQEIADDANISAGLKWQSFTIQPFRYEITRVISHYLAPGSPRELNLSHRDRASVLHALQQTTHPSAFALVSTFVEGTLRGQSHPNFIRWSICNGNKPRVIFVRTMGIAHTLGALLLALLLTLSSASRWFRLTAGPVMFVGLAILVAAWKGLCVILHHTHGRNLKPWEQGSEGSLYSDGTGSTAFSVDEEATLTGTDAISQQFEKEKDKSCRGTAISTSASTSTAPSTVRRPTRSFDPFGSSNTAWRDERWVRRYSAKPLVSKVFDQSVWVQEESVRLVQDRIVRQSNVWAAIVTVVFLVVFVALPKGNLY